MFEADQLKDLKRVSEVIAQRKEVLAVEYLDKKNVFGKKASVDEMSSFKSKVKKQDPIYDPEVEAELAKKRRQDEIDAKRAVDRIKEAEKEAAEKAAQEEAVEKTEHVEL